MKTYSTLMIDNGWLRNGIEYVENIFNAIGPVMSDLTVNFNSMDRSCVSDNSVKMIEKCSKFETLSMVGLTDFEVDKFERKRNRMTNSWLKVKDFRMVKCDGLISVLEGLKGPWVLPCSNL